MTVRTDITMDWESSPRIATIAAPSTELNVQDLHDTLVSLEDSLVGGQHTRAILSSGKEDLGSAVLVGITSSLQNTKIAFEGRSGPSYVQCNISGGNLVALDSGGSSMSPIEPSAYTQIVQANSSSATQTDQDAIRYSSYQNSVWLDASSSNTGEDYPSGTREYPVNNAVDAAAIAIGKGFDTICTIGNYTFTDGDNIDGLSVIGQNVAKTIITMETGASAIECEYHNCHLTGILDGASFVER